MSRFTGDRVDCTIFEGDYDDDRPRCEVCKELLGENRPAHPKDEAFCVACFEAEEGRDRTPTVPEFPAMPMRDLVTNDPEHVWSDGEAIEEGAGQ